MPGTTVTDIAQPVTIITHTANKKGCPPFIKGRQPDLFHFPILSCAELMSAKQFGDSFCLRMSIDKNQRNDQCVNTQRFDHSETDQHGNCNFA